jgi:Flp pilus assembly secretin CpaC
MTIQTSNSSSKMPLRTALRWAVVAAGSMLYMASAAAKTAAVDEIIVTPPTNSADPAVPFITEDSAPTSHLNLLVNKGVSLTTKSPFKRVYVGQPDIADANALGQNRLLITGKKPGTTQVIVWDDNEKAQVLDVLVQIDIAGLKEQLKDLFPHMKVEAVAVNGEIILRGRVPSVTDAEQLRTHPRCSITWSSPAGSR